MPLEISSDDIFVASRAIRDKVTEPIPPKLAILCGPGLEKIGECMQVKSEIAYSDIPKFPEPTVDGAVGKVLMGDIGTVYAFCLLGYVHYYEGLSSEVVGLPIMALHALGVELLILVSPATGLNPEFSEGDVMLVKDHINFMGLSGHTPLRGQNDGTWGSRFQATNKLYSRTYNDQMKTVFATLGCPEGKMVEGVYACVGTSTYETPAEVKLLRTAGADAVGTEIVNEVMAAKHCGVKVIALALITNKAVDDLESDVEPNEEAILNKTKEKSEMLKNLVGTWVAECTPPEAGGHGTGDGTEGGEGGEESEKPAADKKACGCPAKK